MSTTQLLNIPFESQKKSAKRATEVVIEDEFLMTRKYVGEFLDYRHTGPETSDGPNIIWIKTSMDKTFGKLSAYGKNCDFTLGDNLYIRRIFYSPGDVQVQDTGFTRLKMILQSITGSVNSSTIRKSM